MRLEEDVLGRVQDMIDAIQAVAAIVEGMDEASFRRIRSQLPSEADGR